MVYLSFNEYGVIGNSASCALVSRLGSIDWSCLPYLDSPSHFAAILDDHQGGKFQISPQGEFRSEQRYLKATPVLETIFETPFGRGVVSDWMPFESQKPDEKILRRQIEVLEGRVKWLLICTPRFGYGRTAAQAESFQGGILFRGQTSDELVQLKAEIPIEISANGNSAIAQFELDAGQNLQVTLAWGRRMKINDFPSQQATIESWRGWAHRCPEEGCIFAGPWHDAVIRSSLVLKLLLTSYSGSLAESVLATLSGGQSEGRTWDYRYAWIKDGILVTQALANLGYLDEAKSYFNWIQDLLIRDGIESLQAVYTLDGGKFVPERETNSIAGYLPTPSYPGTTPHGSRKFRLDIYGQVMLTAANHFQLTRELDNRLWVKLEELADYVCQAWRRPDHGSDLGSRDGRGRPEHFVVSKLWCWAALDKACWLARQLQKPVSPKWGHERSILHRTLCEQGFDSDQRSFVRAFGERELDSGTLLIPFLGFLPSDDPRIQGTLDAIASQLGESVFIHRSRSPEIPARHRRASLPNSFLFISALALCNRVDEATDRLAEICSYASPLGLFGEEIDLSTGENLGSFPNAAAHLGLLNAALYIGAARGRYFPRTPLLGMAGRQEERPMIARKTA